ncbi:hypothetical protein [Rickettsia endosymbiont of Polydrusus tereticollis]|uniref:hypothetical protein n=1 Tax=Rickettsia endosymbiont of Polydrusus tereticollis TaxID=3066251 RepID=UPI0031333D63
MTSKIRSMQQDCSSHGMTLNALQKFYPRNNAASPLKLYLINGQIINNKVKSGVIIYFYL